MRRKRLTITLNPDVLAKVDGMIDGRKIRNRSHAIENILKNYFGGSINTAVILAGGKKVKKTPLFKLNGNTLLHRQIEQLSKAGIKKIILNTNDDPEYYTEYVKEFAAENVNLVVVKEEKPLGTAGVLFELDEHLDNRTFLVIHGDVYIDLDVADLLNYSDNEKYLSTLVLTTVSDPVRYGMVKVRGREVVEFFEKPKSKKTSNLVSAGVYIVSPGVFDYIKKGEFQSMEEDVFPKLAKDNTLSAYIHSGVWFDITYSEMYKEAVEHCSK